MAVLECKSDEKEGDPSIIEWIEVCPWRLGGKSHQEFSIASLQESLDKFKSGEQDVFGFGDMLPETSVILKREKHTYNNNGEQKTYVGYRLKISADIGTGICRSSPGARMIGIKIDVDEPEAGLEFMRQLVCEIGEVHQEKHPDPADIPAGSSDWNFARQVNQKAYDRIAVDYDENYFSKPLLTEAFDAWLHGIPAGGHILDLGCGHGKPVIAGSSRTDTASQGATSRQRCWNAPAGISRMFPSWTNWQTS